MGKVISTVRQLDKRKTRTTGKVRKVGKSDKWARLFQQWENRNSETVG